MKPRVIIFIGYFFPGFKSGGPAISIQNLIASFHEKVDFFVVTNAFDKGESHYYENIILDDWNQLSNCKVYYSSNINKLSSHKIQMMCADSDYIYCCGCYDLYAIRLMLLNKKRKIKNLIVASMGNFFSNALNIKKMKKKVFLFFFKLFGLFNNITWSATSQSEKEAIHKAISKKSKIAIACDLPTAPLNKNELNPFNNVLHIIFLSRIVKNKNLLFALKILKQCKSKIIFDIYGVIEDEEYWNLCSKEILSLPKNIICKYHGEVQHSQVLSIFSNYEIFLFPSFSENFGHVIYEAMASGCTPIISNTTYWQNLEENKIGYCIDLNDAQKYISVIEEFYKNPSQLMTFRKNALTYAKTYYEESKKNSGYLSLFHIE